jgi:hypothetical protein
MILQRDPRLRAAINDWGCYLCSIFFLVNKYTNRELSTDLINTLYHVFHKRRWIDEECTILNPNAIFGYLGMDVKYTDRHERPSRTCAHDEVEILYFEHPQYGGHFVVGDGWGHVAYDPWGVSRTATDGTLVSKRIFRRL